MDKYQQTEWGSYTWLWEPSDPTRDRLSAALVRFDPGARQPPHSHSSDEQCVYVLSGHGISIFDGIRTELAPGKLIHLPAYGTHELIASRESALEMLIVYAPAPLDVNAISPSYFRTDALFLKAVLQTPMLAESLSKLGSLLDLGILLVDSAGEIYAESVNLPPECASCLLVKGNRPWSTHLWCDQERLVQCCPSSYFVMVPLSKMVNPGKTRFTVVAGPINLRGKRVVPRSRLYTVMESIKTIARLIEAVASQRELELAVAEQILSFSPKVHNDSATERTAITDRRTIRNSAVARVVSALHSNSNRKLTLSDAARMVGMSASHFSRLFSREMGVSFVKYCNLLKIFKAKALLASTDMTIKEIASQLGFQSTAYFGRVFSTIEGKTPSQFRQSLLSKK